MHDAPLTNVVSSETATDQAEGVSGESGMNGGKCPEFDEVGYWSEVKLAIVREYAAAYSKVLSAQDQIRLRHVYIDAFAGAGVHISKTTGKYIAGSPLNALLVEPPFEEFFLIDIDGDKIANLRKILGDNPKVHVYKGNCNEILLDKVFPQVRYEQYRRGLCLLDPYGLHLDWKVVEKAGEMRTIDMFLNFPIMDMNRNVLWRYPEGVGAEGVARMTAFWGDESWRKAAYREELTLFGPIDRKRDNEDIAEAFRSRLKTVAGFRSVPQPMPMRNTKGAVVYYLFFASQKPVAQSIVEDIFRKYSNRQS